MNKCFLSSLQCHCGDKYFDVAFSLPFPSPNCCYLDLPHLHFSEKQVNKLHRAHMQLPEDFLQDSASFGKAGCLETQSATKWDSSLPTCLLTVYQGNAFSYHFNKHSLLSQTLESFFIFYVASQEEYHT